MCPSGEKPISAYCCFSQLHYKNATKLHIGIETYFKCQNPQTRHGDTEY
jgi:hypothetical protein